MLTVPRFLRLTRLQALAAVAVATGLLSINDALFFESVVVPTGSMEPTILRNERAFLTRWPRADPRRFDVVVVDSRALGARVVKRVIGLPGDRVRVADGWRVTLNGQPLDYRAEPDGDGFVEAGDHRVRAADGAAAAAPPQFGADELMLGTGEYFVMGDNRPASRDSRSIGPVSRDEIQGTLGLVWYSFDLREHRPRLGRIFRWLR